MKTHDFWGGQRTIPAITAGIGQFRLNILSQLECQGLSAVVAIVSTVAFLQFLESDTSNGHVVGFVIIGFVLVLGLALSMSYAAMVLADLGDAAGIRVGFTAILNQSVRTTPHMLAYLPASGLTLWPRYAFAPYVIADTNCGPLTALRRSRAITSDQAWRQTLQLELTNLLAGPAGGIVGDFAQAGAQIALAGRYLELKQASVKSKTTPRKPHRK